MFNMPETRRPMDGVTKTRTNQSDDLTLNVNEHVESEPKLMTLLSGFDHKSEEVVRRSRNGRFGSSG